MSYVRSRTGLGSLTTIATGARKSITGTISALKTIPGITAGTAPTATRTVAPAPVAPAPAPTPVVRAVSTAPAPIPPPPAPTGYIWEPGPPGYWRRARTGEPGGPAPADSSITVSKRVEPGVSQSVQANLGIVRRYRDAARAVASGRSNVDEIAAQMFAESQTQQTQGKTPWVFYGAVAAGAVGLVMLLRRRRKQS